MRESFPNTPINMSAVLPCFSEYGELVKHFNTQLSKVCAKNKVTFFDICSSFVNLPYSPDGLHFTHEGYYLFPKEGRSALLGATSLRLCTTPSSSCHDATCNSSKNQERKRSRNQACFAESS